MKQDNALQVYYDEKLVGTLAMTANRKAAFQYSDEWLEHGFSISPFSLPLKKQVFIAGTALCLPIGVRKVSGDEKAELQLERGALGSQPTEEKLEVSVGNQKPERITLSVPARAYSAEEIEEAFSAAIEALDDDGQIMFLAKPV